MEKLDPTHRGPQAQRLHDKLCKRVVSQREAVDAIVEAYQTYQVGFNPKGRPICNMLFLGPTGVGKTKIVEALAESLLGNERALVKIDCGEFQHSHEIAKLIGSPPGYLGHKETQALLSQKVLSEHHTEEVKISFVLFDEIEKASDALWSLLLGILDKGLLTLGDNSKVDFSRSMIFMTSNLGAKDMDAMMSTGMGFATKPTPSESQVVTAGMKAVRKKFTPEFVNRLDKVVVFQRLEAEELKAVLDIELASLQARVCGNVPFVLDVTKGVKELLLEKGTDAKYGARSLKRVLETTLVQPLANLVASEQVRWGDRIEARRKGKAVMFHRVAEVSNEDLMTELGPVALERVALHTASNVA